MKFMLFLFLTLCTGFVYGAVLNSTISSITSAIETSTSLTNRGIAYGNATLHSGTSKLANATSRGVSKAISGVNATISSANSTLHGAIGMANSGISSIGSALASIPVFGSVLQSGTNMTSSLLNSTGGLGSSVLSSIQTLKARELNFLNKTVTKGTSAFAALGSSASNAMTSGVTTTGKVVTNIVNGTATTVSGMLSKISSLLG